MGEWSRAEQAYIPIENERTVDGVTPGRHDTVRSRNLNALSCCVMTVK